eukprot:UN15613
MGFFSIKYGFCCAMQDSTICSFVYIYFCLGGNLYFLNTIRP